MTTLRASLLLILTAFSVPTFAGQCIVGKVKEVGTWVNPDTATRSITKAIFREECRDASTGSCSGDICSITSGVKLVYTAELWGKCSPTDCKWGKVDGIYTPAKWLKFNYDHGFAKRVVWGQVWSGDANWLNVTIDTDFVDPNRADYQSQDWLKRQ